MSIKSWKRKYAMPSSEAGRLADESKATMRTSVSKRPYANKGVILATLRKLEGMKPENLAAHGLKLTEGGYALVQDEHGAEFRPFAASECAFCLTFMAIEQGLCRACPGFEDAGRACYREGGRMGDDAIKGDWSRTKQWLRDFWRQCHGDDPIPPLFDDEGEPTNVNPD
jgi:hypothetical protein